MLFSRGIPVSRGNEATKFTKEPPMGFTIYNIIKVAVTALKKEKFNFIDPS